MRILLDAIKLKYLSNLAGSSTNSTQLNTASLRSNMEG